MKLEAQKVLMIDRGRSPQGERGLKYLIKATIQFMVLSLSARRAWIEISTKRKCRASKASLSARRAWIEIIDEVERLERLAQVALRKESVD